MLKHNLFDGRVTKQPRKEVVVSFRAAYVLWEELEPDRMALAFHTKCSVQKTARTGVASMKVGGDTTAMRENALHVEEFVVHGDGWHVVQETA
jgi:hypothetical protein